MGKDKEGYYAHVRWHPGDVLTLKPDWTEEQAEEWLSENEKYFRDRLVELGWQVMEDLL